MSEPPTPAPPAQGQDAQKTDGSAVPADAESKPEPPQAPPAAAQAQAPSAPARSGSSSKKKKKKNKKASVSALPAAAAVTSPALTSTQHTSAASPPEPAGNAKVHDVAAPMAPVPESNAVTDDKVASSIPVIEGGAASERETASASSKRPELDDSAPTGQDDAADEEQPNFGDHVVGGLAHQPQIGVPAPMPPQASTLFVDEAEDMAFLISNNKEDNIFEVPPPEIPTSSTPPQSIAPGVPPPPLVDDDVEQAAFDSTATLDATLDAIGLKHAEQAASARAQTSTSSTLAATETGAAKSTKEREGRAAPGSEEGESKLEHKAARLESKAAQKELRDAQSEPTGDQPKSSTAALFTDDAPEDAFAVGSAELPAPSTGVPESPANDASQLSSSKGADTSDAAKTLGPSTVTGEPASLESEAKHQSQSAASMLSDQGTRDEFDIKVTGPVVETETQSETKDPASTSPESKQPSVSALFSEGGDQDDFNVGGDELDADQVSELKSREAAGSRARRPISLFDTDDQVDFDIPSQEEETSKADSFAGKTAAVSGPAKLFGDDNDEAFDIGQHKESDGPSETRTASDRAQSRPNVAKKPDVSSLFSDSEDFLNDTSIDESFQFGDNNVSTEPMQPSVTNEVEAEVPQGWYDEGGNWNWYTDEEREAVRQAMIADGSLKVSAPDENQGPKAPAAEKDQHVLASGVTAAPSNPYVPAPADPYAPATPYAPASATQGYRSTSGSYSAYQPHTQPTQAAYGSVYSPATSVGGYGYSSSPAPAAPAAPAFTPAVGYATQPYAATPAAAPYDPYALASTGYNTAAPPAGPAASSPKKAEPLKRPTKSDAYDPPLRPKKSFIGRPGSAAAVQVAPISNFVPPADAPPLPQAAPPAQSAPPTGPPRRSKTTEPPSLTSPSQSAAVLPASAPYDPYAPQVAPPHSNSFSAAVPHMSTGFGTGYAAAPVDPYAAQRTMSPPAASAPPQRPATSSSQHPPKPTSFDPPLRPTSSRPASRHSARPTFSPPPAAAPPVPPIPSEYSGASKSALASPPSASAGLPPVARAAEPIQPPPRGPSRGATRTPKFERPPPPPASAPPANNATHYPPPRSASPQAPPRTSSPSMAPIRRGSPIGAPPRVTSPAGAPPRVSSPLRNEPMTMASIGSAAEQRTPKFSQSTPLRDEQENDDYDPEGGHWEEDDDEAEDMPEKTHEQQLPKEESSGYESHQPESGRKHPPSEPKSEGGYEPPVHAPSAAAVHQTAASDHAPSQYQPSSERAGPPSSSVGRSTPSQEKTGPYESYGSQTSPKSQRKQSKDAQSPYAPPPMSSDSYSRHSAPISATSTGADPYGLSHSRQTSDPYGAPSQQSSSHKSGETYTPYAPSASSQTEYSPYAPNQPESKAPASSGASQTQSNPYAPSRQFTTDFNPYGPSTSPTKSTSAPRSAGYSPYGPSTSPKKQTAASHSADYSPYGAPKSPQKRASLGSVPAFDVPPLQRSASYEPSPYEPSPYGAAQSAESASFSPMNSYNDGRISAPPTDNYARAGSMDATYVPQQVREQRPVSEDPLGRCSTAARNVPIARFGFGGYLVTAFPGAGDDSIDAPSYGYGSHRGSVTLRPLPEVVESSALVTSTVQFPGPLVHDPSTPKGAAGDKKRREAVMSYLTSRAEEIERGLPYLKTSANKKRREEEAKLVILRLLTALVEGDGRFFGTPKAQEVIREALQSPADSAVTPAHINGLGATHAPGGTRATASQLSQLSAMLLSGDKRGAAQFAASAGLWSHALLVASSVGPDLWRELVTKFSIAELGNDPHSAGLKATYMVYAGLNPTTVEGLFAAANITDDPSTDKWREVIAGVLQNGKPTDLVCLDDLGARFERAGLRSVAQVCFLLSPNSPFSDMSPAATTRHIKFVEDARDEDGAIFAEIAEYARSLVPVPKGAEAPQITLPELLPFKLQRAWRAAELGDVDQAKRYCEAIETAGRPTAKGSTASRLPGHLRSGVEDLLERLTGTPSANPSRGLGRSKSKSGATIGSWIEGRLTKFIAGEDEGSKEAPKKTVAPTATGSTVPVGPFSHFSAISPNPSAGVSRAPSTVEGESLQGMSTANTTSTGYEPYGGAASAGGGYTPWDGSSDDHATSAAADTSAGGDDGGFISPMASLTPAPLAPAAPTNSTYAPPAKKAEPVWDDDEDDLGFGNSALSRARTPKVEPAESKTPDPYKPAPKKEEPKKKEEEKNSDDKHAKKGWFGGWFGGKKDGESSGPVRANLGEESKMYYDPELKRWLVKGAEKPPAAAAAPPPPPRTSTASPASRPSTAPRPGAMGGSMPSTVAGSPSGPLHRQGALTGPPTGPPTPAGDRPPHGGGTPGGTPGAAKPPVASLDDLLNRPPSGRPTSGATKKKRATNRYVDVFNKE